MHTYFHLIMSLNNTKHIFYVILIHYIIPFQSCSHLHLFQQRSFQTVVSFVANRHDVITCIQSTINGAFSTVKSHRNSTCKRATGYRGYFAWMNSNTGGPTQRIIKDTLASMVFRDIMCSLQQSEQEREPNQQKHAYPMLKRKLI